MTYQPIRFRPSAEGTAVTAPPAGMDGLRDSPPPTLIGDFARDAYLGACSVAELLAVIRQGDRGLQIVTELYLHMMHDVAYTVDDAMQALALDPEDVIIQIARLIRRGIVRRAGSVAQDMPLQNHHRLEIVPPRKAELSGFFARARLCGPAILDDWPRLFL